MLLPLWRVACLIFFWQSSQALRYDPLYEGYNLNENKTATEPRDYWGQWPNHTYQRSPSNWRFPFYVLTLDRFVDGNPTNNEANGTVFEHSWTSNQFRFGGDVEGVLQNLDYLSGMGIKAVYFTGSSMLNLPWEGDGFGPLDFTLLDKHHGDITEWRRLVDAMHERGMYVIFDNTVATMGDLMGYGTPYTNTSVTWSAHEFDYVWKRPGRQYHDFQASNDWDDECQMPQIWETTGYLANQTEMAQYHGCRNSEFEMYGDIESTGSYPSYRNQFSRFAAVQDRLREWRPDVLEKINVMSCIQIAMLDIDGFRIDKGVQITLDALTNFSTYQRECARQFGKDNFFISGEMVSTSEQVANYIGRGKTPDQELESPEMALTTSQQTSDSAYIRAFGKSAIDGIAFNYDVYGALTRFLRLDGPWGAFGVDWVEHWNTILQTHDLVNVNTGVFDPRHMFGTSNQDVFRWPALGDGMKRQLLGMFVTYLEFPGIPMLLFGEEQASYILENQRPDYVYGRQPLASSRAWQMHGCYTLGQTLYRDMPYNSSLYGCHDDTRSLDQRDTSHPVRNIVRRMFELRQQFPVLNDGFNLTTLSTHLYEVYLPGSYGIASAFGVWSVHRGRSEAVQDLSGSGAGNMPIWQVFHNENTTVDYDFDCSTQDVNRTMRGGALLSTFAQGTTVKNLFYPYDEYTLQSSPFQLNVDNETYNNGCLSNITLRPYEFKAFVPKSGWQMPSPVIARFIPRHDDRILSTLDDTQTQSVPIQIHFSQEMDCQSIANTLELASTTVANQTIRLNNASIECSRLGAEQTEFVGQVPGVWNFSAILDNVANGVHTITVVNASNSNGTGFTNSRDKYMFRIGHEKNPVVFSSTANYTTGILQRDETSGSIIATPRAAGADMVRYSTNWGSSYTSWFPYTGKSINITRQTWSGTKAQEWTDEHVIFNFWSNVTGSSDHVQHTDLEPRNAPRRWPHAFIEGIWNEWGSDPGLKNEMSQEKNGSWSFKLFTEWPSNATVSVWGVNPDGLLDKSATYGDFDNDGVLDWVWPDSLSANFLNMSQPPTHGKIGYKLMIDDATFTWHAIPYGSQGIQILVMLLICIVPFMAAVFAVWAYRHAFYKVRFNQVGARPSGTKFMQYLDSLVAVLSGLITKKVWNRRPRGDCRVSQSSLGPSPTSDNTCSAMTAPLSATTNSEMTGAVAADIGGPQRKTVLIATMEYVVPEWNVKIKIGGLGVMSELMDKNLGHQDLVHVIPCVGGVDYPITADTKGEGIVVKIRGKLFRVDVHYIKIRNVTFVLLDAPVFRSNSAGDPYPARMDDPESAIYYSTWNQCIAEAIRRFQPDLYHINDYHGACAQLYLLPQVIPCCLSLHNAAFQGAWPLSSDENIAEYSSIWNLSPEVIKRYIQFGEVFNLLHAGASYLRIHQRGFGAVGVSTKYGKRVLQRYPIFWGLHDIGGLPNPDPTDTAEWNHKNMPPAPIDQEKEQLRGTHRRQAQAWAGLIDNPRAELFIFVGRWSVQKGVDLIADVFPSILEENKHTQLICIGPVVDLYGKFAALKLEKLMKKYPGRVYSKPEFTAIPPYLFSGAEFALMPSRDEPFGLVAVEFGRKGALCVGARVGGFGNMPGWWFNVEAMTPRHLIKQFKLAIRAALASNQQVRAEMRAWSLVQRFPVAQWIEDLDILQNKSITSSKESLSKTGIAQQIRGLGSMTNLSSLGAGRRIGNVDPSRSSSRNVSRDTSMELHPRPSPSVVPYVTPESYDPLPLNSPLSSAMHSRGPSRGTSRATSRASSPTRFTAPARFDPSEPLSTPDFDILSRNLNAVAEESERVRASTPVQPTFSDTKGVFYDEFSEKLEHINPENSESQLCIEEYIIASEKKWFHEYHSASLRNKSSVHGSASSSLLSSIYKKKLGTSRATTLVNVNVAERDTATSILSSDALTMAGTVATDRKHSMSSEYAQILGDDYNPPTGARHLLQRTIYNSWPVYCMLLAFGQIVCANPYQITLLTGDFAAPASRTYILSVVYLIASLFWWLFHRRLPSLYVLSLPFGLFAGAFLLLGCAGLVPSLKTKNSLYLVATIFYSFASAAGAFFFSLNFSEEFGSPSTTWAFRACIIAGSQQLLIAALWYFGSAATTATTSAIEDGISPTVLSAVTFPLAAVMTFVGVLLYLGLPQWYRNKPGAIPSFYSSTSRRGVVAWFWIMVILQGFFLSTLYNRNWTFLWQSAHAPKWTIGLLVVAFFGFVWVALLAVLGKYSKEDSWVIPIFAIGLGAPRWCQMLWSLSGIAYYLPWAGLLGGSLVARVVWLWLGVLDALQGVGFGMILFMTLTRVHITWTLTMAQALGAIVNIIAKAISPDRNDPGTVFVNIASDSLASGWFWAGLISQLIIAFGRWIFFRKAQLMKP